MRAAMAEKAETLSACRKELGQRRREVAADGRGPRHPPGFRAVRRQGRPRRPLRDRGRRPAGRRRRAAPRGRGRGRDRRRADAPGRGRVRRDRPLRRRRQPGAQRREVRRRGPRRSPAHHPPGARGGDVPPPRGGGHRARAPARRRGAGLRALRAPARGEGQGGHRPRARDREAARRGERRRGRRRVAAGRRRALLVHAPPRPRSGRTRRRASSARHGHSPGKELWRRGARPTDDAGRGARWRG